MKDRPAILLIDGEIKNIELQKACLEPYKYDIVTAPTGREAQKVLTANSIDLILLSITMSEKDRAAISKYLASHEKTCFIPVIQVNAPREKKKRSKGGYGDFFGDPIDMSELADRIQLLVEVKTCFDRIRNSDRNPDDESVDGIKELNTALRRIEESSPEIIQRIAAAAECRDQYTSSHILRVSHYAAAIARKMELKNTLVKTLLDAAPLHDIGKIGIPDKILKKSAKLNDDEWNIMQRHSLIGAEILHGSNQDYIKMAEEIALTHHEKWNGTGYPHGLEGEHIPISGRIVAIADVFDALISERPYKPPLPIRDSFMILRNEQGTHFDPYVVDAFISIKKEVISILERYQEPV